MSMKPLFFLPLMTYPDQTSERVIANAVDLARNQDATLQVTVIEVSLAPISDAWALILVDMDSRVSEAGKTSRRQGARLLDFARRECVAADVPFVSETISI